MASCEREVKGEWVSRKRETVPFYHDSKQSSLKHSRYMMSLYSPKLQLGNIPRAHIFLFQ